MVESGIVPIFVTAPTILAIYIYVQKKFGDAEIMAYCRQDKGCNKWPTMCFTEVDRRITMKDGQE